MRAVGVGVGARPEVLQLETTSVSRSPRPRGHSLLRRGSQRPGGSYKRPCSALTPQVYFILQEAEGVKMMAMDTLLGKVSLSYRPIRNRELQRPQAFPSLPGCPPQQRSPTLGPFSL